MHLSLRLSTVLLLINSFVYAQTPDSLRHKKEHKFHFELLQGLATNLALSKGYPGKTERNPAGYTSSSLHFYGHGTIAGDYDEYSERLYEPLSLPTIKMAFSYQHKKWLSYCIGLRYYSSVYSAQYEQLYHYDQQQPHNYPGGEKVTLNSNMNTFELSGGPKLNAGNFFFSATLNYNYVISHNSFDRSIYRGDVPVGYATLVPMEDKTSETNTRNAYYYGAGASIGYSFPLTGHILTLQLTGSYYNKRVELYYIDNPKLHALNMALMMGFRF